MGDGFSEHRIWIEPHESHSRDGRADYIPGHYAEIYSRRGSQRVEVHLKHLGIYSNMMTPEENYIAGRDHHYSALTIGRQLNDAANLADANARKWRTKGRYETADALTRASTSLRESARYAFAMNEREHNKT